VSARGNTLAALAQCAAALEKWQQFARDNYNPDNGDVSWYMEAAEALRAAHDILRAPWTYELGYSPGNGGLYIIKRVSDDKRTVEAYGGRLLQWQAYPSAWCAPKRYAQRGTAYRAMRKLHANGGRPK
jgi:hypothetical protein